MWKLISISKEHRFIVTTPPHTHTTLYTHTHTHTHTHREPVTLFPDGLLTHSRSLFSLTCRQSAVIFVHLSLLFTHWVGGGHKQKLLCVCLCVCVCVCVCVCACVSVYGTTAAQRRGMNERQLSFEERIAFFPSSPLIQCCVCVCVCVCVCMYVFVFINNTGPHLPLLSLNYLGACIQHFISSFHLN